MPVTPKGWQPKRQHRRHIYYKVQVFDATSLTWRDQKDAFDEVEAARAYIMAHCAGGKARIMVVEGRMRYPLPDDNL